MANGETLRAWSSWGESASLTVANSSNGVGSAEAVALEAQPGEDVHGRPYSAGAGGSPVARTSSRAASSSTGTPRLSALASLDPAASPATR